MKKGKLFRVELFRIFFFRFHIHSLAGVSCLCLLLASSFNLTSTRSLRRRLLTTSNEDFLFFFSFSFPIFILFCREQFSLAYFYFLIVIVVRVVDFLNAILIVKRHKKPKIHRTNESYKDFLCVCGSSDFIFVHDQQMSHVRQSSSTDSTFPIKIPISLILHFIGWPATETNTLKSGSTSSDFSLFHDCCAL